MKKILLSIIAACLCIALYGCGNNGIKEISELNILTWDGYIPEDILSEFEESTGITVFQSNFDSNEEMLTKISSSSDTGYDLVIGSDYIIDIARNQDLLHELDKTKIPNYKNLDENFLSKYYDPENKYTVPYAAGTPLIVYDPEKIDVNIEGYDDLWNEKLAGKLVTLDDGRNIIGMTLKSMGLSMNTTDEIELNDAKEKLLKLKPNIHHLDYNNPHESIISGEADLAYMFTPQVCLALQERPGLKVVYPKEGLGFGIDCWFIPKSVRNLDNAHAFLNFITDAKIGARISEQVLYLCPNKASVEYLSDDFKNNKAIYIPEDKLTNTEFIQDVGDSASIYDEIWTVFKQ